MSQQLNKNALIQKWLNDDLNDAEKRAFSQLEDAELNNAIIEKAKAFKAPDVNDFETFKTYYKNKNTNSNSWFGSLLKIACILVVGFTLYFVVFGNTISTFSTEIAEKTTFELPDNSVVELNAASEASFNKKDWANTRVVTLKGEAYFKVAKGKTFNVITDKGIVSVVGTEFNVKQREDFFNVECFEGTVQVSYGERKEILNAGDTFKSNNSKLRLGSTGKTLPDWTSNKSSFSSETLGEVLKELQLQYNIELQLNNVDSNRLFTGGFSHNDLNNALLAITKPMNLTYSLSASNQVVIHGENQ